MAASPFATSFDDPRITPHFCRHPSSDAGDVILAGVVHDHPASVARAELLAARVRPSALALELPPAAVPLYRAYARDDASPPEFGGEMSAAIAAAPAATVHGIDAPNWSFLRRLCSRLLADRVSPSTARRVVASLGDATRDALTCRVAATLSHATSVSIVSDDPIDYGCDAVDPAAQADHERAHVAGVRALLGGADASTDSRTALAYRDETRERCMADRLRELRAPAERPVLAIVGVDHLDPLAEALA